MSKSLQIVRRSFQDQSKVTKKKLEAWQQSTGFKLPDDYAKFILEWNGGTVNPFTFPHQHPLASEDEKTLCLQLLDDWQEVLDESQIDEPVEGRTMPPAHLAIGTDLRDYKILLSLEPSSHGKISTWQKVAYIEWGEPDNNQLGVVAGSFSEFLGLLHESDDGYHGLWCRPENKPENPGVLEL